ncbi:MAG: AAA family ATPase [Spirochaetes bacterium]|jgi:predicted ATPase/serine phosphatase RsbU (regulator of sigma subunit)|nr:AAA family ATPase [Spirochaetota bacterium]
MIEIPGYSELHLISESEKKLIYRARDTKNSRYVILKILRMGVHSVEDIRRFHDEYSILKEIDLHCVIRAYSLIETGTFPGIVYEDFNGITLSEFFSGMTFGVDHIRVACATARALADLQIYKIIHLNINPSNILIDPETKTIKIIDFSAARSYQSTIQMQSGECARNSSVAYIAPEQTGRMNCTVDYRADFYSLGATLFELASGQLLFDSDDPIIIIHSHIARRPQLLSDIRPEIPRVFSKIVAKLLEKMPDKRYQSPTGLLDDLERCRKEFETNSYIHDFQIAQSDVSPEFIIGGMPFGRDREITILKNSFDWIRNGHAEMVLVSGSSGVGKSYLIKELDSYSALCGGIYLSSHCDTFNQNTPYYSLKLLLNDFITQVLMKSEREIAYWRQIIPEKLGDNLPLLLEFIPGFANIVESEGAPELSEIEREVRSRILFQQIFSIIASEEHPLVLVIEDVEWIDSASLNFLHLIMLSREHTYLLVVTSARNTLSEFHPFSVMVRDINMSGVRIVQTISLHELSLNELNQLLSVTLRCPKEECVSLAKDIYGKTGGNPFFIREFITSLYNEGVFQFAAEEGRWNWNSAAVSRSSFSGNMLEIMVQKIEKLDRIHKEPLIFASCIGITFSLEILSELCRKPKEYIEASVRSAVEAGLIFCYGEEYRFAHERIREAARSVLSDEQMQVIHRQIGHFLLDHKQDDFEQNYFSIVNHLNYSLPLITEEEERYFLAALNSEAGRKAKLSAAYKNSYRYYQTGVKLMPENGWQNCYDLAYQLNRGAADAALLAGELSLVDNYANIIISNSPIFADKVEVYSIIINARISQNRLSEAVNIAFMVLSLLGIEIPKSSKTVEKRLRGIHRSTKMFSRIWKRFSAFKDLPLMTNEMMLSASTIIARVSGTALISRPDLYPLLVSYHIDFLRKNGNSPVAPQVYAEYAAYLCTLHKYEIGLGLADLALRMCEDAHFESVRPRVMFYISALIDYRTNNRYKQAADLAKSADQAQEEGDFEYSALSLLFRLFLLLIQGESLSLLHVEIADAQSRVEKLNQRSVLPFIQILNTFATILTDETSLSEKELQNLIREHTNKTKPHNNPMFSVFTTLVHSLLLFFSGFRESAVRAISSISEEFYNIRYSFIYTDFIFFKSLILASSVEPGTRNSNRSIVNYLEKSIERYRVVVESVARTGAVRYYLLQAELMRIQGKGLKAEQLYDQALHNSRGESNNFLESAIVNEITARFFFNTGRHVIARAYIQDAFYNYQRWGAMYKVRKMERDFPEFLKRDHYQLQSSVVKSSVLLKSDDMDLNAVITASHSITGEIDYETLIIRLMTIIMEHSGAARGCLILDEEGAQSIEAESVVDNMTETRLKSELINERTVSVPVSLINYVSRKRSPVILDDALTTPLFSNDSYIINNASRSVLCLPILYQEKFTGLLYLENNLASGVFSPARVRLLELICTQAAISIQNSKYYDELKDYSQLLETKVQQRTSELEQVNENLMDINRLLREARIEAERDMEMAANVQLSFMPTEYSDKSHWDIAFSYKPMSAVSGDFYDFYEAGGVLHGAAVFDVSGHGISSGLITVIARSIISRIFLENLKRPLSEVIEKINSILIHEIGHTNNYLTGVLIRFKKDGVEYVNAAHPNVIKYERATCQAYELCRETESWRGGFLGIAAMKGTFGEMNVKMKKDDILVLYSDGLTEGGTKKTGEFGCEGVIHSLEGAIMGASSDVLTEINRRFNEACDGAGLGDDYTVIVVRKR